VRPFDEGGTPGRASRCRSNPAPKNQPSKKKKNDTPRRAASRGFANGDDVPERRRGTWFCRTGELLKARPARRVVHRPRSRPRSAAVSDPRARHARCSVESRGSPPVRRTVHHLLAATSYRTWALRTPMITSDGRAGRIRGPAGEARPRIPGRSILHLQAPRASFARRRSATVIASSQLRITTTSWPPGVRFRARETPAAEPRPDSPRTCIPERRACPCPRSPALGAFGARSSL